jgi:hypothetical protein
MKSALSLPRALLLVLPAALVPVACTSILGDFTTAETTSTSTTTTGGLGGSGGAPTTTTASTSSVGGSGGSGGGTGGMDASIPPSPECISYCADVMAHCVGNYQQYTTNDVCLAVCMAMPPGQVPDDASPNQTTTGFACRRSFADLAKTDSSFCPPAGPDGSGACGSVCDAFCEIAVAACPGSFADTQQCLDDCNAHPSMPAYGVGQISGDSYGCRMYQLTQAALDPSRCPDITSHSTQCRCDQGADCNQCGQCAATTPTGNCTELYVACINDASCTDCSNCLGQCAPDDDACAGSCATQYGAGCQKLADFGKCYLCDECTGICDPQQQQQIGVTCQ